MDEGVVGHGHLSKVRFDRFGEFRGDDPGNAKLEVRGEGRGRGVLRHGGAVVGPPLGLEGDGDADCVGARIDRGGLGRSVV